MRYVFRRVVLPKCDFASRNTPAPTEPFLLSHGQLQFFTSSFFTESALSYPPPIPPTYWCFLQLSFFTREPGGGGTVLSSYRFFTRAFFTNSFFAEGIRPLSLPTHWQLSYLDLSHNKVSLLSLWIYNTISLSSRTTRTHSITMSLYTVRTPIRIYTHFPHVNLPWGGGGGRQTNPKVGGGGASGKAQR